MARVAVFEGLVADEADNAVNVTYIGGVPHYVVNDAGFLRHIPSEGIDQHVLNVIQEEVLQNREAVVQGMLQFLGKDDLFTKAAIEASLGQMPENIKTLLNTGLPEDVRQWLGLMGLRVIINVHGDVVKVVMPGAIDLDE